ncbi:MAG: hypothetical protein HYZ08_03010 [Candidatus Kerfeldbacteria bacterium]|nr:hypothetical protein [Candidatus Kerfeldbacteria bacterium]
MIAICVLGVFVFISSIGILLNTNHMMKNGTASCPFSMESTLCPMGIVDHVSMWRKMFEGNAVQEMLAVIVAGFAMTMVVSITRSEIRHGPPGNRRVRDIQNALSNVVKDLRGAFAQGILHPRRWGIVTS